MEIEIAGKVYHLNFGMGFIEYLNNHYVVISGGVPFGAGLRHLGYYYAIKDPTVLSATVMGGLHHLSLKPTKADIDLAVTELIIKDGLDKTIADFFGVLREQPLLKDTLNPTKKTNPQKEA